jgi:transposase
MAKELLAISTKEYVQLQTQIDEIDAKLTAWHRADECSRRLAKIPGVGPIGAVLMTMKTPDPARFQSGRQFAACIGLTPKDHSTAGKVRLGVITRAGDEGLVAANDLLAHVPAVTTIGVGDQRYHRIRLRFRGSIARGPISHAADRLDVSRERFLPEERKSRQI